MSEDEGFQRPSIIQGLRWCSVRPPTPTGAGTCPVHEPVSFSASNQLYTLMGRAHGKLECILYQRNIWQTRHFIVKTTRAGNIGRRSKMIQKFLHVKLLFLSRRIPRTHNHNCSLIESSPLNLNAQSSNNFCNSSVQLLSRPVQNPVDILYAMHFCLVLRLFTPSQQLPLASDIARER